MAVSDELIDFDLIETHKENIQSLPGGRSARQLASILSPMPSSGRIYSSPTLDETKTLNDAIRQEYEVELQSIADSDDPLDIYDRYVKWTLNAYPSAQATPQSQLLPLLERATKAFLTSAHYKNDPRYLKLWLHYIRLFSDAPRETFAFLARHNVGEGLGLFYEEFATWLEGAGRWAQAEEVYKLGIEREARPAERLMRKYDQFQKRFKERPPNEREPTSPALPTVRLALAAKIDPYASLPRADDPQASRPVSGGGTQTNSRSGKPKMAIFSDTGNEAPPFAASTTEGWDSIGSLQDRKKENIVEARPWAGETLKAGKKVGAGTKMAIFKDPNLRQNETSHRTNSSSKAPADVINPRTGRAERVFVNVEAVYPNEREEFSFEELRAMSRGWASRQWRRKPKIPTQTPPESTQMNSEGGHRSSETADVENLSKEFEQKGNLNESSTQGTVEILNEVKPLKQKRLKIREIKQETQTVKTRLESPTGRKIRRKNSADPTMTFHSKAATDEIYNMFNQPLKEESRDDNQSGDDTDFGDDDYSTAGESTGTGRISGNTSEYGEDTMASVRTGEYNTGSQPDSVSPWSEFTASKHLPRQCNKDRHTTNEDLTEHMDSSQNQTQTSGFDTQAIAAIANQDFGDFDTRVIAVMAGDFGEEVNQEPHETDLKTPISPVRAELVEIPNKPRYVPLPPEDYEPTPLRPFRDPAEAAQNRLPFMTPIVEKTESSFAPSTIFNEKDYFNSKTPSRSPNGYGAKYESPSRIVLDQILLSSPQRESPSPKRMLHENVGASEEEHTTSSPQKKKFLQSPKKHYQVEKSALPSSKHIPALTTAPVLETPAQLDGPVVLDLQCNPCHESIRKQILASVQPSLSSYKGYHDHSSGHHEKNYSQLKKYVDKLSNAKAKASPRKQGDKTLTQGVPPILKFTGTTRVYAIKRLLGAGAFAPVYLADSYDPSQVASDDEITQPIPSTRAHLEAIKTDFPPLNSEWEFYILRLLSSRLSTFSSEVLRSLVRAHECHVFSDEAYLVLDYHSQGTLLDLVNWTREERVKSGKPAGEGVEEVLAMWFAVEVLKVIEAVHAAGILHGDLKGDNCLVRFDGVDLAESYSPHGAKGWEKKGITLIDFGRGIDHRAFKKDVQFIADWPSDKQDCAEIREMKPWVWQIDYFGLAGIVHNLLFGRMIETVEVAGSGLGRKEWKLKESLKRYWQQEIWGECFHVLVNPGLVVVADGGLPMSINKKLREVRQRMEAWLELEGERRDLRGSIRRAERLVGEKGRGRK